MTASPSVPLISRVHHAHLSVRNQPGHHHRSFAATNKSRWSIKCWHWIHDTQLHEDAHRYRGNGAGTMATLRTTALNLQRLAGFCQATSGIGPPATQNLAHPVGLEPRLVDAVGGAGRSCSLVVGIWMGGSGGTGCSWGPTVPSGGDGAHRTAALDQTSAALLAQAVAVTPTVCPRSRSRAAAWATA